MYDRKREKEVYMYDIFIRQPKELKRNVFAVEMK